MFSKKQPVFYVGAALFFFGYLFLMRTLLRIAPENALTDTFSFLVMVAVLLPLSAASAAALQRGVHLLLRVLRRLRGRRA